MQEDIENMIEKLKQHEKRLATERDDLRNTLSEYEALADNVDTAIEDIEHAIMVLSELV